MLENNLRRSQIRISTVWEVPNVPQNPPVQSQPFYSNNQFPQGNVVNYNYQNPFPQNVVQSNYGAPGYQYPPPPNPYNYPPK